MYCSRRILARILLVASTLLLGLILAETRQGTAGDKLLSDPSGNGKPNRRTANPEDDRPQLPELKMSIRVTNPESVDSLRVCVTFENVSNTDTVLNLGLMLNNGRIQSPAAIRLGLTDSQGRSRELQFADSRYAVIAGRVDVYALPLCAGGAYTLKLRMKDYWCPSSIEYGVNLKPGEYRIRAEYTGEEPRQLNSDIEGLKFLPFWTGKLETDWAPFDIGKQG